MMNTLSALQQRAITLLASGATVSAAATELGIDRTTFYHWRRSNPAFIPALNHARDLHAQSLADGLQDLASAAIETLRELVGPNSPASPAIRLRAAQAILKAQQPPPSQPDSTEFDTIPHSQQLISNKIGRNHSCPCGSGIKYKRCCGNPVQQQPPSEITKRT